MTTIREHLRALEELPGNTMLTAAEKLAFVEVRAQAALALLEQAEERFTGNIYSGPGETYRLVPDPVVGPGLDNTKGTD